MSALGGVAAAVATAYLSKANTDPNFGTQTGRSIAIGVVGGVAIIAALARPLRAVQRERVEDRRSQIAALMRGLAWTINEKTGIDVKTIGASTWISSGYAVTGWRIRRKLYRVARERVNDSPIQTTGIVWTKNKGVIGICWATAKTQVNNTGALHKKYKNATKEEWDQAPDDHRLGLSHAEFQKITGKYGTVIAVPMLRGEKVIGVVALDAPAGCYSKLKKQAVVEAVVQSTRAATRLLTRDE